MAAACAQNARKWSRRLDAPDASAWNAPSRPAGVIDGLKGRYPFLDLDRPWQPEELRDHLELSQFQEARARGWFDAAVYTAELHPRRLKIIDYCSSYWNEHGCDCQPYPSLEHWRRDAENYLPPENVAD